MKKIGKKLSFLTKIMLVVGLLVSNLSSLSRVFAYEVPHDVVISLEEDNLVVKYTELLDEDVNKVRVDVYESYTYLDGNTDTLDVVSYELDETQIESAKLGELELTHTKSMFKLFDGTYKFEVKFYEIIATLPEEVNELESLETLTPEVTEELITMGTYTKEITYKSGLGLKVYDNNGTELSLANDRYSVNKEYTEVTVDVNVLAGGLAPSDVFMYEEVSYTASELLEKTFTETYEFDSKLYGEYEYPISVELLKLVTPEETELEVTEPEYENVTYSTSVKFMYGSYADNTNVLNDVLSTNNMRDEYYFYGNGKNGILYNIVDLTNETVTTGNMLDLYNVLEAATDRTEITYKLFKGELDLIQEYNNTYGNTVAPVTEGEEITTPVVTLEDYLKEVSLDGTVKVTLSLENETISYSLVVLGDVNGDNTVNEADVDALIEVIVTGTTDNQNADVYGLDGVNSKDVLYLNKVLKNNAWNTDIVSEDATLDIELKTDLEETELVSGDTFTVDYILKLSTNEVSGFSGKFDYDKEALELVSVESLVDAVGLADKETGKFFYLGSEVLELPEEETETNPEEVLLTALEETSNTVVTADYAVVKATFRVLKSGTHTVNVKDTEYYNVDKYLNAGSLQTSLDVEVLESDDNTLSYLEVAGTEIELVDGVFEYELTVKNEVTLVDLKYILSNVAASVSSAIYPEELVEGANEVTITVVSESGLTQDYKVVITREEAVKETTTKVNYNNYQPNYERPKEEETVTPVVPEEPVEEEKESNLSKIIIMVLIVLVIGGLVYLIFKDDEEAEVKSVNKKINKLKKEDADFEVKATKNTNDVKTSKNTKEVKSNNKKKSDKKKSNNKKR